MSASSQKSKRNPSTFAVGAAVKLFSFVLLSLFVRFRPFLFVKQMCVPVARWQHVDGKDRQTEMY